jgi:bacillithiol biosynthesis cysteine-adding enzyme BshC
MTLLELPHQHSSTFMLDFLENKENMDRYFDYPQLDSDSETINKRYQEITNRNFPREELSSYIEQFHQSLPTSEKVKHNIKQIRNPSTVCVVGGQQAGILSGPLFTLYKCITLIKYAAVCEQKLGVPVVPIFWIAGEDHDYDEMNHVYIPFENAIKKMKFGKSMIKQSLTEMEFQREDVLEWSKELIQRLGETKHTKGLYKLLQEAIQNSNSYTEFFAFLIASLFKEYGLLLLDSGDHRLRKIESAFFEEMINKNTSINNAFLEQTAILKDEGYSTPIEEQENNAHLFINIRNERVLLYRDKNGMFVGKNNECVYTKDELLAISKDHPTLLSNNVVTRPLMQEFIIPTLAFVGGPGEIAYWSTLKKVFHLFDRKVPPLLPRLSITLIEPKVDKIIKERQLVLDNILQNGVTDHMERWLDSQISWNISEVLVQVKGNITKTHKSLSEIAIQVSHGLEPLAQKNLAIIQSQIDFLGQRIEKSIRDEYKFEIEQFNSVEQSLKPMGIPQERVWNIFYYLNQYGYEFIDKLLKENYNFNKSHKVFYL